MFGFNPYALLGALVGALALFGSGAWTGHKVTSNAWRAAQAAQETALRERYAEEVRDANARAEQAERAAEAIRAGTRVVTRYVDRIVTRPVYSRECLDADGISLVKQAITGIVPEQAGKRGASTPHSP